MLESRKQQEREYHNLVRSADVQSNEAQRKFYTSNGKFYSVHGSQRQLVEQWWAAGIPGKRVLDYCCGNGVYSIQMAGYQPKQIVGIDISDVSVANAAAARAAGHAERCHFQVMDAENLEFPPDSFDVIHVRGVLHHLDLEKAYASLAKVLSPDGVVLCQEPIRYNPVFQWYRRRTPHLRTPWEVDHILGKSELRLAEKYFRHVRVLRCFYLFSLLAVPFRHTKVFPVFLRLLESIDRAFFAMPGCRWLAWSMVIELREPLR